MDELVLKHKIIPRGVLHLGGNVGEECIYYVRHGFAPVIWVEAIPEIHAQLAKKVVPFGHVAICACLSDTDGEHVTFHVSNNAGISSSFLSLGSHARVHPTVHYIKDIKMITQRADTLLSRHGIAVGPDWFLSVDLQGAELKAMQGLGSLIDSFAQVYVEINDQELYIGCPLTKDIDAFLAGHGFHPVQKSMSGESGWGDCLYLRNKITP